jgi:hypothetical protein
VKDTAGTHPMPILVGLRNRVHAEVLYGLEPGDTVLVRQAADTAGGRTAAPRMFGFGRR